ncbi:polyhydroxyalkanoic acid system family protein [Candidatus Parcubacteria bacterium]|nr:polyhydroxyalkanoic acid system family protein [Candidatus Parcubacteria bacterium]
MAKIKMKINHKLTEAEALKRIKKLLSEVKDEYGSKITGLREKWKENKGEFAFSIMNYDILGTLEVTSKDAELEGDIPWSLGLFKKRIEKIIKERAQKLLKK